MTHRVVMMACERTPNLACASLESLFVADPMLEFVDVVVDGQSSDFLAPWIGDCGGRARVHLLNVVEDGELKHHHSRVARTFHRCLKLAQPGEDLVIVQDDVAAAANWLRTTLCVAEAAAAFIADLELPTDPSFLLQLFCAWPLQGRPYHRLSPGQFFSCVGTFFPANMVPRLEAFFTSEGYAEYPDDLLVQRFLMVEGDEYFAINPSVIQHTGSDASTHGARPCTSPTYGAP